ncbi:MAG: hypothetical protein QN756_03560, partial [Nitrososphaeraceae archaeon]|nr:hypothetical protein [Nitrososphaeraceae archaeon]
GGHAFLSNTHVTAMPFFTRSPPSGLWLTNSEFVWRPVNRGANPAVRIARLATLAFAAYNYNHTLDPLGHKFGNFCHV